MRKFPFFPLRKTEKQNILSFHSIIPNNFPWLTLGYGGWGGGVKLYEGAEILRNFGNIVLKWSVFN